MVLSLGFQQSQIREKFPDPPTYSEGVTRISAFCCMKRKRKNKIFLVLAGTGRFRRIGKCPECHFQHPVFERMPH